MLLIHACSVYVDSRVEEDSPDTINTRGDHLLEHRQLYGLFSDVEFLHINHAEVSAQKQECETHI